MTRRFSKTGGVLRYFVLLGVFTALFSSMAADDVPWHVQSAPIRFTVSLAVRPSHESAGFYVHIPDGGILPKPHPVTRVVDESGNEVKSYSLWHNNESGMGMVFEVPKAGQRVYVYVTGEGKFNSWSPETGIHLSVLQCTDPYSGTLEAAKKLSSFGSVRSAVNYDRSTGHKMAPLCTQPDQTGRPLPYSIYLISHVFCKEKGRWWFSPNYFMPGAFEVRVDGQVLNPKGPQFRGVDGGVKQGAFGEFVQLTEGIHRLEIFAGATGSGPAKGEGVCYMLWRWPSATIDDLGGPIKEGEPGAGSRKYDANIISSQDIVKSGKGKIVDVNMKNKGPVAVFDLEPLENYWFEGQRPLFVYGLTAFTAGNPKDTEYVWNFSDGITIKGPKVNRFLEGQVEHKISLTAISGTQKSQCEVPLYAYSDVASDLEDKSTRANFRKAFLDTIKLVPEANDPTATWTQNMWDCLFSINEYGEGQALLAEILVNRWKFFQKKIPVEQQEIMEDIFFNWMSNFDPDKTVKWLEVQRKISSNANRRKAYDIMEAEIFMYQSPDLKKARELLKPLVTGGGEMGARASIRMGDVAFLEGNVNEANDYWGAVQNRVNITKDMIGSLGTGGAAKKWEPAKLGNSKKDKNKPAKEAPAPAEEAGFKSALSSRENIADWKKAAVLDTSMSSTVISLIGQEYFLDAYNELRTWERNFPLSKISGDYILQEAKFYLATGNTKRAKVLLKSYCENLEASSYIAEAAKILLDCMMKDNEPDDVVRKFCEDMKKRFEFHPFADQMEDLIRIIGKDGVKVKREATLDKF